MRALSKLLTAFAFSATMTLAGPAAAAMQPQPLAETDPRAMKASGLVEKVLSGDYDGAVAYLKANAAPGSEAAADPQSQIDALKAALPIKTFQVNGFAEGLGDVIVQLGRLDGAMGRVGVVVDLASDSDPRIQSVRAIQGRVVRQ